MPELIILVVSIVLALGYAYGNGMNDAANTIATVVSTRTLSPGLAVIMAGTLNAVGAFTGVAGAIERPPAPAALGTAKPKNGSSRYG